MIIGGDQLLQRGHQQPDRRHERRRAQLSFPAKHYGVVIADPAPAEMWSRGISSAPMRAGRFRAATQSGLGITGGASGNLIGGTGVGAGNLISANTQLRSLYAGPWHEQQSPPGQSHWHRPHRHQGVGNYYDNVALQNDATGNFIGGIGAGNIIAFAVGTAWFYDRRPPIIPSAAIPFSATTVSALT